MLFTILCKEAEIYENASGVRLLFTEGLALSGSKYTYTSYFPSTFHTNFPLSS